MTTNSNKDINTNQPHSRKNLKEIRMELCNQKDFYYS